MIYEIKERMKMEKYFIVKNEDLIEKTKRYEESVEKVREIYKKFVEKYEIKTPTFCVSSTYFGIVPTPKDKIKFGKDLKKDGETFKCNSAISKDWINTCKENNIDTVKNYKPTYDMWQMICRDAYKVSTRLFSYEGIVYGSFETNRDFKLNPDDFEELKPSEFYVKIGE